MIRPLLAFLLVWLSLVVAVLPPGLAAPIAFASLIGGLCVAFALLLDRAARRREPPRMIDIGRLPWSMWRQQRPARTWRMGRVRRFLHRRRGGVS